MKGAGSAALIMSTYHGVRAMYTQECLCTTLWDKNAVIRSIRGALPVTETIFGSEVH